MKTVITFLLVTMLVACGKSEPTATPSTSGPTETVESLVANPERLKDLRQQCKTDRVRLGDELW